MPYEAMSPECGERGTQYDIFKIYGTRRVYSFVLHQIQMERVPNPNKMMTLYVFAEIRNMFLDSASRALDDSGLGASCSAAEHGCRTAAFATLPCAGSVSCTRAPACGLQRPWATWQAAPASGLQRPWTTWQVTPTWPEVCFLLRPSFVCPWIAMAASHIP